MPHLATGMFDLHSIILNAFPASEPVGGDAFLLSGRQADPVPPGGMDGFWFDSGFRPYASPVEICSLYLCTYPICSTSSHMYRKYCHRQTIIALTTDR